MVTQHPDTNESVDGACRDSARICMLSRFGFRVYQQHDCNVGVITCHQAFPDLCGFIRPLPLVGLGNGYTHSLRTGRTEHVDIADVI